MDFAELSTVLKVALSKSQYDWKEIRGGLAIEFGDGCDAMYITVSSHDVLLSASNAIEAANAVVERYRRLNQARAQVLIGLRHYAAEQGAAIQQNADGRWNVSIGGMEGEFEVGAPLTNLVCESEPAEALRLLIKGSGALRAPSPKRASRLVSYVDPPNVEHLWEEFGKLEPTISPQALAMDCSVLDRDDLKFENADEFANALIPHKGDPGIKVIERMVRDLGATRFEIDLCGKGAGDFEFTDEETCFRIHPRGRRMRRLIKQHGIEGAAEALLTEFHKLDRARTRCLGALETILHRAGLVRHLGYWKDGWAFGKTHREFLFDPLDGLTAKLRSMDESEVLLEWLIASRAVDPVPSQEELDALIDGSYEKIAERSLPIRPPSEDPSIAPLEVLDIDLLNNLADDLIATLRKHIETRQPLPGGNEPLWLWQDPLWYRRGVDTWADEAWWMERARIRWRIDQDQFAAFILLANGDSEPIRGVLKQFRELDYYHHEACNDGVIWLLKDQLPWDMEKYDGMPDYPPELGPLPPELARPHAVAARQALGEFESAGADDGDRWELVGTALNRARHLEIQTAREWLDDASLSQLHDACIAWAARTDDFSALNDGDYLDVAANFGWPDVVETLEKNPVLFQAVMNDEFGPPDITSFALRLSLVHPGVLAARLAAHIILLDPQEAAARAMSQEGELKRTKLGRSMMKGWISDFRRGRIGGAIAWHRCRDADAIPAR